MGKFACGVVFGTFSVPIVVAVVILFGWIPVGATSDPPRWETSVARRVFAASLIRQAPRVPNPIAPTSANLLLGLTIYRDNCSGCHGDSGKPSHWGTTGFYPRVPQFDSELPLMPDWQMFWIVRHGVRYTGMGAWEGEMSEQNTWEVVTFLSHLKELPAEVQQEWRMPTAGH